MDAEVYPDERVAGFVSEHFLPARIHVREQKADWDRYSARFGVQWTPTILIVDPSGTERHRIEGFLPVEEFLAQLVLGLGRSERCDGARRHRRGLRAAIPGQHLGKESVGLEEIAIAVPQSPTTRPRCP
ncbi:MAG: thioredoxin family protein [Deltaproteobacteria bacterium]|nr:MAG: thioredoxin family protein [Deltaproteobacteria bacterium]